MNVMEVQHAVYLQGTHKTHACMQVKHGILYLHHPLKHVGQREEGDKHIFFVRLQCALDDKTHRVGRGGGGVNGHRKKTEERRQEGQENIKGSKRVNLSLTGILDVKQGPSNRLVFTFYLIQIA